MYVVSSGDVSLESARFVRCTSGAQGVPRARTRSPPPRTHARTPSPRRKREKKAEGQWGGRTRFPQRAALGLPALSRSLTPSQLMPARTQLARDKWLFCPEWVLFLPKRIHIHSLAFLSILHMHMHSQSRVSIQQNSSSFKTLRLIQHHSPNIQCLCTFTP